MAESVVVARRPWRAALLSLLAPGLGHVYAGNPRRGVLAWLMLSGMGIVGSLVVMLLPPQLHLLGLVTVGLGLPLLVAWDAARVARLQSTEYSLRGYNRWYVYLGVLLLIAFVWQPLFKGFLNAHVVESHRLMSGSMEPTLLAGDYIMSSNVRRQVQRGAIVVYRTSTGAFTKRVIAQPGDTVAMRSGILSIGGVVVPEPYAQRDSADPVVDEFLWQRAYLPASSDSASYRPSLFTWGPLVIPPDKYFLLGDNRSFSLDSRFIGLVPRDSIIGQPTVVYFSRDPRVGSIRWRRMGRPVQVAPDKR